MDCQIRRADWCNPMDPPGKERAPRLKWASRQHHQDNPTTSTKLYVNQNFSDSGQLGCHQAGGCNSLTTNSIQTERHLFVVGRQLMQLVEPAPQHRFHLAAPHKLAEPGCARIKAIMKIYLKLLNAGPLELQLQSSCPRVLQLRQQVLSYIEALPGYCDSINSLRLILKSPKMINALQVYHEIVTKLEEQNRKLNTAKVATYHRESRELSV